MSPEVFMTEQAHEQEITQTPSSQTSQESSRPSLLNILEGFLQRIEGIKNLSTSAISEHSLKQPSSPASKEPFAQPK